MTEWLMIAMMVSSLWPLVQEAVERIEELAKSGPNKVPGEVKKEQVLNYLKGLLLGTAMWSKLSPQAVDAVMVSAGNMIDMVVFFFNKTGKFKKTGKDTGA